MKNDSAQYDYCERRAIAVARDTSGVYAHEPHSSRQHIPRIEEEQATTATCSSWSVAQHHREEAA